MAKRLIVLARTVKEGREHDYRDLRVSPWEVQRNLASNAAMNAEARDGRFVEGTHLPAYGYGTTQGAFLDWKPVPAGGRGFCSDPFCGAQLTKQGLCNYCR